MLAGPIPGVSSSCCRPLPSWWGVVCRARFRRRFPAAAGGSRRQSSSLRACCSSSAGCCRPGLTDETSDRRSHAGGTTGPKRLGAMAPVQRRLACGLVGDAGGCRSTNPDPARADLRMPPRANRSSGAGPPLSCRRDLLGFRAAQGTHLAAFSSVALRLGRLVAVRILPSGAGAMHAAGRRQTSRNLDDPTLAVQLRNMRLALVNAAYPTRLDGFVRCINGAVGRVIGEREHGSHVTFCCGPSC